MLHSLALEARFSVVNDGKNMMLDGEMAGLEVSNSHGRASRVQI